MLFQDLWRMNDDGLAIALASRARLDVAQRRKVEDAMGQGGNCAGVVCNLLA